MNDQISRQLKPCPFCGGSNIKMNAFGISADCYIICEDCGAMIEKTVPWGMMNQESHDRVCAIGLTEAWNKRVEPPADQWIPCSSGKMPEHEADVLITLESFLKDRRYVISVRYFTETGVVDEYEWTGEGFYSYDSEYGWGKHEDVIAWKPAEPYKGVE